MNSNELNKQNNKKRQIEKEYKMGKKYFVETNSNDDEKENRIENHISLNHFLEASDELSPTINLNKFSNNRKK